MELLGALVAQRADRHDHAIDDLQLHVTGFFVQASLCSDVGLANQLFAYVTVWRGQQDVQSTGSAGLRFVHDMESHLNGEQVVEHSNWCSRFNIRHGNYLFTNGFPKPRKGFGYFNLAMCFSMYP